MNIMFDRDDDVGTVGLAYSLSLCVVRSKQILSCAHSSNISIEFNFH